MKTWLAKVVQTTAAPSTILVRLMVGAVFLSEGIQKFLFADALGAGRFAKIGLPMPELLGPLVGTIEIIAGISVLLGLLTRAAAFPLLAIMIVAILTTKADMLSTEGLWPMLHGSRTDWAMLLGSIYLLINGGGLWSLDYNLSMHYNTRYNSDELNWVI